MDARDPLAAVLARHAGRSHVSRLVGNEVRRHPPAILRPHNPAASPRTPGILQLLNTRRLAVKEVVHHHYILLADIIRSRNGVAARDAHMRDARITSGNAVP